MRVTPLPEELVDDSSHGRFSGTRLLHSATHTAGAESQSEGEEPVATRFCDALYRMRIVPAAPLWARRVRSALGASAPTVQRAAACWALQLPLLVVSATLALLGWITTHIPPGRDGQLLGSAYGLLWFSNLIVAAPGVVGAVLGAILVEAIVFHRRVRQLVLVWQLRLVALGCGAAVVFGIIFASVAQRTMEDEIRTCRSTPALRTTCNRWAIREASERVLTDAAPTWLVVAAAGVGLLLATSLTGQIARDSTIDWTIMASLTRGDRLVWADQALHARRDRIVTVLLHRHKLAESAKRRREHESTVTLTESMDDDHKDTADPSSGNSTPRRRSAVSYGSDTGAGVGQGGEAAPRTSTEAAMPVHRLARDLRSDPQLLAERLLFPSSRLTRNRGPLEKPGPHVGFE